MKSYRWFICFVGAGSAGYLAEAAYDMALGSEHHRTRRLQARIFKNYLGFCCVHHIKDLSDPSALLRFMYSMVSPRTISNYMSALKSMMDRLGMNVRAFDGVILRKFRKALLKIPVTKVLSKCTFTIDQVKVLLRINKAMGGHYPYAVAFSLGLFVSVVV